MNRFLLERTTKNTELLNKVSVCGCYLQFFFSNLTSLTICGVSANWLLAYFSCCCFNLALEAVSNGSEWLFALSFVCAVLGCLISTRLSTYR